MGLESSATKRNEGNLLCVGGSLFTACGAVAAFHFASLAVTPTGHSSALVTGAARAHPSLVVEATRLRVAFERPLIIERRINI